MSPVLLDTLAHPGALLPPLETHFVTPVLGLAHTLTRAVHCARSDTSDRRSSSAGLKRRRLAPPLHTPSTRPPVSPLRRGEPPVTEHYTKVRDYSAGLTLNPSRAAAAGPPRVNPRLARGNAAAMEVALDAPGWDGVAAPATSGHQALASSGGGSSPRSTAACCSSSRTWGGGRSININIHHDRGRLIRINIRHDREDASSMVAAGATANTTEGNSRASGNRVVVFTFTRGIYRRAKPYPCPYLYPYVRIYRG